MFNALLYHVPTELIYFRGFFFYYQYYAPNVAILLGLNIGR